jgi:glycerol-3-phosphate dehydrogenase
MKRDVDGLAATPLDLLIIGGGAYGVCAAWEAALRGLRVALVERGDFGEATSSNSLHTMHGGLRYLQHLDIRRMRESIRERRFWLRAAPELITPMPFVLPTFRAWIAWPRGPAGRAVDERRDFSGSKSRREAESRCRAAGACRARRRGSALGALRIAGFNGAALWYDGFNSSPERLLIALLRAAGDAGAQQCELLRRRSPWNARAGASSGRSCATGLRVGRSGFGSLRAQRHRPMGGHDCGDGRSALD